MIKIGDNSVAHIYFIGAICHDIILHVEEYPAQDEKISTREVEKRRGGNSGNSLEVLCQLSLDKKIYFLGAFGGAMDNPLAQDLYKRGISLDYSVFRPHLENSQSWIISTGESRTVINYNPVPDMDSHEFSNCLSSLHQSQNWFHFEGRNISQVYKMITLLQSKVEAPIRISIEFEKGDRSNIDTLIPLADILFFSSSFVKKRNYKNAESFLMEYGERVKPSALLFCSWGSLGSFGKESSGPVYYAEAPKGIVPIDSIGAGDTWIASIIYFLSDNIGWREALRKATKIASHKTGVKGFNGLSQTI